MGALTLAVYENGEYLEVIAVMLFYQVVNGSRVMELEEAAATDAICGW